jgi:predicted HicB family RNase H-like nuclease
MNTNLNMKIDIDLKEHLRELAKQDGRSLAGYIHKVLSDHAKEQSRLTGDPS